MALKKCEKSKGSNYILEVSVPKEDFVKEIDNVYRKNVKKMNIPGFRPGKAPKAIIEKMYGNSIFWDDAINNLYPKAYMEAAKEANLDIVGTEKIDIISVDMDNGFTFKVECVTTPEVEVKQYKGLNVTKNTKKVTDEDVNAEIDRIRNSYSRVIEVTDRPAQMNDEVVIDFEGKIDNVAFEGGSCGHYTLKLGSHQFIPGFEEQIVGHKIGEEFDINVTFPKDYHSKELAGKDAVFSIIIHEIKEIELPDLDDDFVKDISEFEDVDSFKADITNSIQKYKDDMADKEVDEKLIDAVIADMEVDLPQIMVEHRIDELQEDFEHKLSKQGVKLEDYLKYAKQTLEEFRKLFKPEAIRNIKLRLALKKIADIENIKVLQEDIDKSIEEIAKANKMLIEKAKNFFDEEIIKKNIRFEKAINLIKSTANIKEIPEEESK